jgi:xanthine dehydrogenase accessory factor
LARATSSINRRLSEAKRVEVNILPGEIPSMTDGLDQTSSTSLTKMIEQVLERGEMALLVTKVAGPGATGGKLLIQRTAEPMGTLGDPQLDSIAQNHSGRFLATRDETRMFAVSEFDPDFPAARETFLLFERLQAAPRLVICGAGHVGASLARLASFTGYQTTLIDDRRDFLNRDRFPEKQIDLLVADDWDSALRLVIGNGRGVSVAVVTRGHNEDEQCMRVVMTTSPDYIGLIGSKRRTSIVIERLRESGVPDDQLRKIHAPIGLDIGAVSPEEVALAIMAEIIAERCGGSGGSLSAWRRSD